MGKKKYKITKEDLHKLFVDENKSVKEISEFYGCTICTIHRQLRLLEIKKPEPEHPSYIKYDKETIYEYYVRQGLEWREVCKILNFGKHDLYNHTRYYGIKKGNRIIQLDKSLLEELYINQKMKIKDIATQLNVSDTILVREINRHKIDRLCFSRLPDMVGEKFGKWTVIELNHEKSKELKKVQYDCICECGKERTIYGGALRARQTNGCVECSKKSKYRLYDVELGINNEGVNVTYESRMDGLNRQYKCICKCGNCRWVCDYHIHKKNPLVCNSCLLKNVAKKKNISKDYFGKVRKEAYSKDTDFELELSFVEKLFVSQNKRCALSSVKLTTRRNSNTRLQEEQTASLDRIDSSKGYTKNNVQWVHKKVNCMKLDTTMEEFINWCELIVKTNKDKK